MYRLCFYISIIVISGTFISCSRSLTDIGYQGGERITYDPSSAGPSYPLASGMRSLGSNSMFNSNYQGRNRYYYISNVSNNDSLTRVAKKGLYFLQKFYVDLNNDFKQNKFSKKYSRAIGSDVEKEISSKAQADSTDIHHGWQIFNSNLSASGHRYVISYVGNLWYSVVAQNNPDAVVLVKLQPATKGKGFVISGLKNDDLNINVTE